MQEASWTSFGQAIADTVQALFSHKARAQAGSQPLSAADDAVAAEVTVVQAQVDANSGESGSSTGRRKRQTKPTAREQPCLVTMH